VGQPPRPEHRAPREYPPFRYIVYAVSVAVAALWALNFAVEWLEGHGVVETTRPDDVVHFVDEDLFEELTSTESLVRWYGTRGIPEEHQLESAQPYVPGLEIPADDRRYYVTTDYAEKFLIPTAMVADKGDRWRMLILGASFAMGTPYTHQQDGYEKDGGMGSFIRAGLQARFPETKLEVINLAAGGQTAHRVARVTREAVAMEPDVLFVATCNNEGPPPPSELEQRLHRLGGYRLLSRVLSTETPRNERPVHPRQLLDADSIEKTFRGNLEDIALTSRNAEVTVLLATMPVNYRYTDEHPPYKPCIEQGVELINAGSYEQAIAHLEGCDELAEAARWMGIALFHLERYEEAQRALKLAVELHPMTQCRPSLNQVAREVAAANEHIHLVDLEAAAVRLSPGGLPGKELFVDFCHMNWRGYGGMAEAVLATLAEHGLGPTTEASPMTPPTVTELAERFGLPPLNPDNPLRR